MGSGAFLVQSCRYLSEKLVEAWENAEQALNGSGSPRKPQITPEGQLSQGKPGEELLPADTEERLALARRLVSERCLYGVDKNPMAVEMAKLSLWLITLAKNRPFTFLDHALRCGDSLLGVNERQLVNWSMNARPGEVTQMVWIRGVMERALATALKLRRQISSMPEHDVRDVQAKERLLKEADEAMAVVKLGGDLLVGMALSNPKQSDAIQGTLGMEYALLVKGYEEAYHGRYTTAGWADNKKAFTKLRAEVDELLRGRQPFNWPLEFPEVFTVAMEEERGFDAMMSNPPFQGGKKITGALGTDYRDYLLEYLANRKRGNADLCAYFFLRAINLVRHTGMTGLLATNTIAQGDTREVGLDQIVEVGWTIPRAIPSRNWPGEAGVEVANIWLRKGDWHGKFMLDGVFVVGITAFLTSSGKAYGNPYRLHANAGKSFIGSYVLGMGFVLEPAEAQALIAKNSRNKEVLFPYLNGENLNTHPDQSPGRWIINFYDWPLEKAETYPDCMKIVRERVKPERDLLGLKSDASAKGYAKLWWQYGRKGLELYFTITNMQRVLVRTLTGKHHAFAFVNTGIVFDQTAPVYAFENYAALALLQSEHHRLWSIMYGPTMREFPRYTPSDCFETFPFPENLDELDDIGGRYHNHRQTIMLTRQEGLTKTYNRFHDPKEIAADIVKLRELHREMDEDVAKAYGWDDLKLEHGFHETKQGLRYTISEAARREVLDRLLLLNHQRHEEEVKAGLFEKKGAKGKVKGNSGKTDDWNRDIERIGRNDGARVQVVAISGDVEQETLF